jgi:hypothetical protein
VDMLAGAVTPAEVYALANVSEIQRRSLPSIRSVKDALTLIRSGRIRHPGTFQNRFHILRHTELFEVSAKFLSVRAAVNTQDAARLRMQLQAIATITPTYERFDACTNCEELADVIATADWGQYFDALNTLPPAAVAALTGDEQMSEARELEHALERAGAPIATYPLRDRSHQIPPAKPYDRQRELADPEVTQIKRQRRNLAHKEILETLDKWLRMLGSVPKENDHIDLVAKIPSNGSFIFEVKSGGDNLWPQVRKAVAQLLEYRYRYRLAIGDQHIVLCLVLPGRLPEPWMADFLFQDCGINVCWFEEASLVWPPQCDYDLRTLLREGHE